MDEPGVVADVPRSNLGGGDPSDCGGRSVTGRSLLSCLAALSFLPPLPFLTHHHRPCCTRSREVAKTFSTVVVLAPVHKSTQATESIVHDPCGRKNSNKHRQLSKFNPTEDPDPNQRCKIMLYSLMICLHSGLSILNMRDGGRRGGQYGKANDDGPSQWPEKNYQ